VAAADLTGNTARGKVLSPLQFVSLLTGKSSLELEVDVVKKLRLLLRNEAARWVKAAFVRDAVVYAGADDLLVLARSSYSWSQDFLKAGGYSALLTRLNELLEVEWR
jgi:hypothetical protein